MAELKFDKTGRLLFTKEMKKEYTILCPMMLPIHFELFVDVFRSYGYKAELLTTSGPNIVQEGLKYVHNDTCYPALLVIGQKRQIGPGPHSVDYHTDGRRLPCEQLYPLVAQGTA